VAKHTLVINENERLLLIFSLGRAGLAAIATEKDEEPAQSLELLSRLAQLHRDPDPAHKTPTPVHAPPAAVHETPAPAPKPEPRPEFIPPREHWAPKFSAGSPGVESFTIEPSKIDRKDVNDKKRLIVLFNHAGKKNLQASCWHEELFGAIANRARQRTTFYITRKQSYINIVGLIG